MSPALTGTCFGEGLRYMRYEEPPNMQLIHWKDLAPAPILRWSQSTWSCKAGSFICVKPCLASADPAPPTGSAVLLLAQPTKCQEGLAETEVIIVELTLYF